MSGFSRRRFVQGSALMMLGSGRMFGQAFGATTKSLVLVGTNTTTTSKGIYSFTFDSSTGDLQAIGLAAATSAPTFLVLAPDKETVYAVNEVQSFNGAGNCGSVTSFKLDRTSGLLTKEAAVATKGGSPVHVAVDQTGHCVFTANYGGGSAVSFVAGSGGSLSSVVSYQLYHGSSVNPSRQTSPHPHRVTVSPDNKWLLVNDLGLDVIHIYHMDAKTGKLTANTPAAWNATPGSGPRSLRFHPNGKIAYCVNEIASTVDVLNWNAVTGTLTKIQEVALLPAGYTGNHTGAEIIFDSQARFAYVSNRGDSFIATFSMNATTGTLTLLGRSTSGGGTPRHIALDPTGAWLLAANQDSGNVAVIQRNTTTGRLATTARTFPVAKAECVVFV